ncbi:MAG: hypothetical protein N2749_00955 [Clostridia bacterium]|nr:hypothetical protein [Clostridia bacterium]
MGKVVLWTNEDLDYLICNFENEDREKIIKRLNRTWKSIKNKASELGLKRNQQLWKKGKPWTEYELDYLKNNYNKIPVEDIAKHLKRSKKSIFEKAHKIELSESNNRPWTIDEENYLIKNYTIKSNIELSDYLNRSMQSIRTKASKLNLKKEKRKKKKEKEKNIFLKRWTKEEEEYIKKYYPSENISLISEKLGRSEMAIIKKANYLGVKRNKIWSEEEENTLKYLYLETDKTIDEISKILGRTKRSVSGKIHTMRLYRRGKLMPWTSNQVKYLKDNFGRKTNAVIAAELGRTIGSVSTYASMHNIKSYKISFKHLKQKNTSKKWQDWEVSFLLENYNTLHWTKIKKILKRSKASIVAKMKKLSIWKFAIKKYVGTRFTFYYRTEEEKREKINYMLWWRDAVYVNDRSKSERDRTTT